MGSIYEMDIPKEIRRKAETMALHYMRGMRKIHNVKGVVLEAWSLKYYESMVRVSLRRCKH